MKYLKMKIKITSIVFLLIFCNIFSQKIEKVEPPFWWEGFKDNNLQLLLYGQDIGDLAPSISTNLVELVSFQKAENDNYLFINLKVNENGNYGDFKINLGNNKIKYSILKKNLDSQTHQGFDTTDVLCLITPDRFINGDYSNDNHSDMLEMATRGPWGRHGGDLKGISDNLKYLYDLGYTAVWLNPVLENNMHKSSYHGYSTTDYYKIDPRFGSNKSFVELTEKANLMGIKMVMDIIPNHCGSEHWFVKDPPFKNWINNENKYFNTTHRRETVQDIHASEIDKQEFVDGWFVETMPDLGQRNPYMSKYLIQNAIWWIEYSGIKGYRVDTYPYSDKKFMSDWTFAIMNEYPKFNIVGEEWSDNPIITSYWQAGKNNPDGYVSYLPSLMDFPLQIKFKEALNDEITWGKGFVKPYRILASDFIYSDPYNLVVFPDNHDMTRFYTQVDNNIDLFNMGLVFYTTIRGIPQFYYGTEILMNSDENPNSHDIIRTEFPGGWKDHDVSAITGVGLTNDQINSQNFFKKLLNWRKTNKAIHYGKLIHFAPKEQNEIYSYFRILDDPIVWVIFNRKDEDQFIELDRFKEVIRGRRSAYDVINEKNILFEDKVKISKKSSIIFEFK
jgi:glycosidase